MLGPQALHEMVEVYHAVVFPIPRMAKDRMRRLAKALFFVALLVLSLATIQQALLVGPFTNSERVGRDNHASFRYQEPNTLDVVYVGASNVYSFWQAPLAWDRYGLASHSYSNWSMPPAAIRYIIQECRKTQPNALYVVNINNFRDEGSSTLSQCHWTTDDMPLSVAKVQLVQALCEQNGYDFDDAIELLFPLVGFHSTWSDLKSEDFAPQYADVGGAATNTSHFNNHDETSSFKKYAEMKASLEEYGPFEEDDIRSASINDLITYCKEEDVSILFVKQPQAIINAMELHRMETICDILENKGMDIVDLSDPAIMNLDPKVDFWNARHTNAHGSIKYTDYLANYIMQHYTIVNRRGDDLYAGWDEISARYMNFLMAHTVFDFEFDLPEVRPDLRVDEINAANMHVCVSINWSAADGADEYIVYRQRVEKISTPSDVDDLRDYVWKRVAVVDSDTTSYIDKGLAEHVPIISLCNSESSDEESEVESVKYAYAVIPVIHGESVDTYGSYNAQSAAIDILEYKAEEDR